VDVVITGVSKVYLLVNDQEAAKRFWITVMGFELVTDQTYGAERWIEVMPPDRRLVLVLTPRQGVPRQEPEHESLPHSNVIFNCEDIEATYAELSARGVKFPLPPARQHFGWWALFEDPDGTRYALGQW
jgi:predicted enzyme related to lactoylglutathione lyase